MENKHPILIHNTGHSLRLETKPTIAQEKMEAFHIVDKPINQTVRLYSLSDTAGDQCFMVWKTRLNSKRYNFALFNYRLKLLSATWTIN